MEIEKKTVDYLITLGGGLYYEIKDIENINNNDIKLTL